MTEGLKDLVINGISVVVVIYGVLEALKQAGWLKSTLAPVIALAIGLIISSAYALVPEATGVAVRGLSLGIAAGVLYAGVKKNAENAKGDRDG
ncbi:MAG TPA: hypothetical protein EYP63_06040 [Desulfotomaculum sp.]|nr:hypothetical protein [Desulfotomaculum sp.]